MSSQGIAPVEQFDQARTAYDAARARVASLKKQVEAQRSAVALARANAEQVSIRRSQLQANEHQQAAANAQQARKPTSAWPTPRFTRRSTASSTSAPCASARS